MIPSNKPSDLSPTALDLYRRLVSNYHNSHTVRANDATVLAAATEIATAGLGTLHLNSDGEATLWFTRLAKGFSVARTDPRDQHLYIEIEVLRSANQTRGDGHLLAALYGATFEDHSSQRSPWTTWNATVRHATARDADHSACILADIAIDHPVLDSHDGFSTTFIGSLSDIKMWPTGTDITLLDSHDASPIDEPALCNYGHCANDPHPYGPYLPTDREDLTRYLGRPVRITTTPIRLVQDNGLRTGNSLITQR